MNKRTKDFVAKVSETDPLLASMLEKIEDLDVQRHHITGNSANPFYAGKLSSAATTERLEALLKEKCCDGCDTPIVVCIKQDTKLKLVH
jgi:hypothetical protein